MTTQHPEALRLAAELDGDYPLTGDAISAAAELRTQHARITELESQLAQRFDAADMATASAQGFRDGVAAFALIAAAPAQPAAQADTQPAPVCRACGGTGTVEETVLQVKVLTTSGTDWKTTTLEDWEFHLPQNRRVIAKSAARAQADSVLYDPKAVLDVFNSARNGSDKPVGYMRGILAVIAHWESRPEPHRWMVPAKEADSVQEDAARYRWLRQEHERVDPVCHLTWKRNLQRDSSEWVNTAVLDTAIDAARKQGGPA